MTTIQDRIIKKMKIRFPNGLICNANGSFDNEWNNVEQFLIQSIKEVEQETRKEILGEISYAIKNSYREVQSPTGDFEVLDPKFLNEQILSITNKEKQK